MDRALNQFNTEVQTIGGITMDVLKIESFRATIELSATECGFLVLALKEELDHSDSCFDTADTLACLFGMVKEKMEFIAANS